MNLVLSGQRSSAGKQVSEDVMPEAAVSLMNSEYVLLLLIYILKKWITTLNRAR